MEKLVAAVLLIGAVVGLVLLEAAVVMWLFHIWHGARAAVPALGLGECILLVAVGNVITARRK